MHVKTSFFRRVKFRPSCVYSWSFYIGRNRSVVDFFKCMG